jgi:hypothetical protein
VLFSPELPGRLVIRHGPPFEWLIETLVNKVGDGSLDFVRVPNRGKNYQPLLKQIIRAGLIGHDTDIQQGL